MFGTVFHYQTFKVSVILLKYESYYNQFKINKHQSSKVFISDSLIFLICCIACILLLRFVFNKWWEQFRYFGTCGSSRIHREITTNYWMQKLLSADLFPIFMGYFYLLAFFAVFKLCMSKKNSMLFENIIAQIQDPLS